MGRGNPFARCAQHIGEILSGVFAAGKEQRYFAALLRGDDARREDAGAARQFRIFDDAVVLDKLEDLHRCVIVIEHLAGGGLPDEFLESRLHALCAVAHHFPLR